MESLESTSSGPLRDEIQRDIDALTGAIAGLRESMRKLQPPIEESHRKVPQATIQLDKISQQTQAATHRMLDTIEGISARSEQINSELQLLESLVANAGQSDLVERCRRVGELNQANSDAVFSIMDALQFQDITAQQMDHAASLLEEIEAKLQHILQVLGGEHVERGESAAKKVRAFDPHADLFEKKTDQAEVDTIFAAKPNG